MKRNFNKILAIMVCVIMAASVGLFGCAKNEEPVPSVAPSATPTATPAPTPTPAPDMVVLMTIPEARIAAPVDPNAAPAEAAPAASVEAAAPTAAQATGTPEASLSAPVEPTTPVAIPVAYVPVDVNADLAVPATLGFTVYSFVDVNGAVQYRAFGQLKNAGTNAYAGAEVFYAVSFKETPVADAASLANLPAGTRIVAKTKVAEGADPATATVAGAYVIGDAANPVPEDLFANHNVVVCELVFDAMAATPVDLTAEAATYQPAPTPEPIADEAPAQEAKADSSDSGKKGNNSSGNNSGGSSNNNSGGGSGGGNNPAPAPEPTPEPAPEPTPEPKPTVEEVGAPDVLSVINGRRSEMGLEPAVSAGLGASGQAKAMAEKGELFHGSGYVESCGTTQSAGRLVGHQTELIMCTQIDVSSWRGIDGKVYTCVRGVY